MQPISVTIPDAVKLSGIPRSALYERIAAGDIPTVKVGRRRLVLYAEFVEFIRGAAAQRAA